MSFSSAALVLTVVSERRERPTYNYRAERHLGTSGAKIVAKKLLLGRGCPVERLDQALFWVVADADWGILEIIGCCKTS